ncbi:hypothetical protein Q3G72_021731 [Acer saccharum]|nr:hypothetical protein Q3G72_021731 [Acer saccharum]
MIEVYSMGIRQMLAEEFGSSPDKKGKLGKFHEDLGCIPVVISGSNIPHLILFLVQ